MQQSCTMSLIDEACADPSPTCAAVIAQHCKPGCCGPNCTASNSTPFGVCQQCTQCALHDPVAAAATAAANCSITDVFNTCGVREPRHLPLTLSTV